jgi:hypothetical protein
VNGVESSIRNPYTGGPDPIVGPLMDNHSLHNFSPRFGFAWDVFGNGKMAVRGGFSLLYDISNLGPLLGLVPIGQPPFSFLSFNPAPPALSLPLTFPVAGNSLQMIDYNLMQPSMKQFNLTVERQLPWNMALTVTYGGSLGQHIIDSGLEGNPVIPGGVPGIVNGAEACVPRPAGQALNLTSLVDGSATACWLGDGSESQINPNWGSISYRTANGNSYYNSLQVQVSKQLSHGLQFQSSYTWSKSLDELQNVFGSDNTFTEDSGPTDPFHVTTDKGPSVFDSAQNWHFNALYHFPNSQASGFAGKMLSGWWLAGIESIQTGYPFSACLYNNQSNSQISNSPPCSDRPNLVPGRSLSSITSGTSPGCTTIAGQVIAPGTPLGTPNLWFDPCAFTLPPAGFLGNFGRNLLRGPGFANLDLTIAKDTKLGFLGESGSLEFRTDFFNIMNHANFQFGNNGQGAALAVDTSSVGILKDTANPSRQIQFALKLLF